MPPCGIEDLLKKPIDWKKNQKRDHCVSERILELSLCNFNYLITKGACLVFFTHMLTGTRCVTGTQYNRLFEAFSEKAE